MQNEASLREKVQDFERKKDQIEKKLEWLKEKLILNECN